MNPTLAKRRTLGLAAATLLLPRLAAAQGADAVRSVAVMSLIGDQLTIVARAFETGTRIDPLRSTETKLNNRAFDTYASRVVMEALKRHRPQLKSEVFASTDATLYEIQDGLIAAADPKAVSLRDEMKLNLRAAGASHLLLVTKHRADAVMRFATTDMGTGKIEGLGFYIDPEIQVFTRGEGDRAGQGFLAPFVYVKVTLVEAASFDPVRSELAMVSEIFPAAGNDQWNAIPQAKKFEVLQQMIRDEVTRVVPLLIP
jgi:hypothetical protein